MPSINEVLKQFSEAKKEHARLRKLTEERWRLWKESNSHLEKAGVTP